MKAIVKILTIVFVASIFTTTIQASNLIYTSKKSVYTDHNTLTVLSNTDMIFRANDIVSRDYIKTVIYNSSNDMFKIVTEEIITSLEILNEKGELEFTLPIGAKKLNLDLVDFQKGTYSVNLVLEGKEPTTIHTTLVKSN